MYLLYIYFLVILFSLTYAFEDKRLQLVLVPAEFEGSGDSEDLGSQGDDRSAPESLKYWSGDSDDNEALKIPKWVENRPQDIWILRGPDDTTKAPGPAPTSSATTKRPVVTTKGPGPKPTTPSGGGSNGTSSGGGGGGGGGGTTCPTLPSIITKPSTTTKPISKRPYKFVRPYDNKYSNPVFGQDRPVDGSKVVGFGPAKWYDRFKKPFTPVWRYYCDPSICGAYWKPACGLNREKMKFRWFRSMCHIALHNRCATYTGFMQYDTIAATHCTRYVMFQRSRCSQECDDDSIKPVCTINLLKDKIVLFKNKCIMDAHNCKAETEMVYEEAKMEICEPFL